MNRSDWLIVRFINWLSVWLIDWLNYSSIDWLIDCSIDWLIVFSFSFFFSCAKFLLCQKDFLKRKSYSLYRFSDRQRSGFHVRVRNSHPWLVVDRIQGQGQTARHSRGSVHGFRHQRRRPHHPSFRSGLDAAVHETVLLVRCGDSIYNYLQFFFFSLLLPITLFHVSFFSP